MLAVRGQFDVTLDGRGRLPLPARLRERLVAEGGETNLVLTQWDGGLLGFRFDAWRRIEEALSQISPFDRAGRDFLIAVVAGAAEVELDAQGRMLVPAALRRRAALESSCVVLSYLDRLEIWSADRWTARQEAAIAALEEGRATVPAFWTTTGAP